MRVLGQIIVSFLLMTMSFISFSQTTYYPSVRSKNNKGIIEKVELTDNETIVTIKFRSGDYPSISFSSATVIVYNLLSDAGMNIQRARAVRLDFPKGFTPSVEIAPMFIEAIKTIKERRKKLGEMGIKIISLGPDKLDHYYQTNGKERDYYYFELHFERLPLGEDEFYIRELVEDGFEWVGVKINNPYPTVPNLGYNEDTIKPKIDEHDDGIVGIYEGIEGNRYKLGCINDNGIYKLIFLGSGNIISHWKIGELKATLRSSATPGLFKANWYMFDKTIQSDSYVTFDGFSMKVLLANGEETNYIKMYPSANGSSLIPGRSSSWSGSGFALKNGYVITNYHVIEGAKTITIKGVRGDFNIAYSASVVASDKNNDLALVKIDDSRFTGFGTVPYSVKTSTSEVGEEIFVLGYPLTSTMGDEIKYTTGVISSKTGFQGDISLYQISAPIQPGNSGCPLFDVRGNLIGIVNAKHNDAENVGYAIKSSYLRNLVESYSSTSIIPSSNSLTSLSRPEQIKAIKKFVFLIECSNKGSRSLPSNSSTSTIGGGEEVKTVPSGAVDLGLRVYWASCNVGASKPEEYGDYYAWGETSTKSDYSWSTYKLCRGGEDTLTKYCSDSSFGIVDNKTRLALSDDVAHAALGGKWRMPTKTEYEELTKNCTVKWTMMNGVQGMMFTSKKNGKSIFLPAAGFGGGTGLDNASTFGVYWSSSLNSSFPYRAWSLYFYSDNVGTGYYDRYYGDT